MDNSLIGQLFDELASESINILRIRTLCRDNPGLIATAGLRMKIWTLLLLGNLSFLESKKDVAMPEMGCDEQHVLDADVKRTRANEEEFRSTAWRNTVQAILQSFCISHSIQYKQGMNEVLAPFIYINPPPNGSFLSYALYEAFVFRYLERYFYLDESSYLFKAFRLFHLLLLYFDPQLALYLHDNDFTPELYSPQWFLTLYSRALPLKQVLRLWDMIITVDDPAFTFFIGLCLIRRKRDDLLLSDPENIPEIMAKIHFRGEEEIDSVVLEALTLYKSTPRCFLRNLRLCCVSSTELTPLPPSLISRQQKKQAQEGRGDRGGTRGSYGKEAGAAAAAVAEDHERVMSFQAARSCMMITAQELVSAVAPILNSGFHHTNNSNKAINNDDGGSSGTEELGSSNVAGNTDILERKSSNTTDFSHVPQQFVLIDIRSVDEAMASGAGVIPRAIQLEPEFLNRPEAFDIWLQHFDGTRGCNICIIDLPPPQWTGLALWRRLLLGESEAFLTGHRSASVDFDTPVDNERKLHALTAKSPGGRYKPQTMGQIAMNASRNSIDFDEEQRKEAQRVEKEQQAATSMDLNRPAVLLALALQRNSFPNVSVLEGGFPALVDQLTASRGSTEPVVINHEPEKWSRFLTMTGRSSSSSSSSSNSSSSSVGNKGKGSAAGRDRESNDQQQHREKKVSDLSDLEKYTLALNVAVRLGHVTMVEILKGHIQRLQKPGEEKELG